MYANSFLSRILGRDADEDESSIDSVEAFGTRRHRTRSEPEVGGQPWDFAVKLAVETIDDLPSNFPPNSAVRIVRRTLAAAGIEIGDFNKCTWARISQISSEMELARSREREFQEKTQETVRYLEGEIRKAREAYEAVLAREEEEISRASKELENIKRVRAFFGFSETGAEANTSPSGKKETQVPGPLYEDSAKQGHRFFSSLETKGEAKTGPIGEERQIRDSLEAAWAQIEATRAQMRERFDSDTANADGSTHGPVEGSSTYSEPHTIRG
jgi:hypothetical protein